MRTRPAGTGYSHFIAFGCLLSLSLKLNRSLHTVRATRQVAFSLRRPGAQADDTRTGKAHPCPLASRRAQSRLVVSKVVTPKMSPTRRTSNFPSQNRILCSLTRHEKASLWALLARVEPKWRGQRQQPPSELATAEAQQLAPAQTKMRSISSRCPYWWHFGEWLSRQRRVGGGCSCAAQADVMPVDDPKAALLRLIQAYS